MTTSWQAHLLKGWVIGWQGYRGDKVMAWVTESYQVREANDGMWPTHPHHVFTFFFSVCLFYHPPLSLCPPFTSHQWSPPVTPELPLSSDFDSSKHERSVVKRGGGGEGVWSCLCLPVNLLCHFYTRVVWSVSNRAELVRTVCFLVRYESCPVLWSSWRDGAQFTCNWTL